MKPNKQPRAILVSEARDENGVVITRGYKIAEEGELMREITQFPPRIVEKK